MMPLNLNDSNDVIKYSSDMDIVEYVTAKNNLFSTTSLNGNFI